MPGRCVLTAPTNPCSNTNNHPLPQPPPPRHRTDEVVDFLMRGASKAVDIIYEAIGPVGPPVRPGSGSLFIVDERRLFNWRDDGWVTPLHTVQPPLLEPPLPSPSVLSQPHSMT